jgi:hypothetical protein
MINDKRFMRQPSEKHGSEWWVERVNETTGVSGVNGVNFKSWQRD